ncbi:Spy/CpxP family protein refolding chaperone [Sphaerospermopsis torques-reginae]|uniref:P pilus assembly/Cpx signaling pathway, periplasmic inhibitor/zinc-resistance associated protein n=1 Tax=Sphaerospermopsis torques-reginae ITEP-024 TaxID=984208 RepID=A0ABX8WU82_9CYAN|nr:P pilus assembly/Cpx signaling pathway, periplasmic inhibitor/zinc-resistance associated protein [Sphaerospermopsis torques-reginae]QYX29949.1 P pilus assembly/Cpx signaling pathway, periplasmic inhibitor/zinc-resistance associated protein [Sphaerospermopsis torques-reginae ITEP-024]
MNRKRLSFLAAAFALTLTATPFVAQAQPTSPNRQPGKEFAQKGPWQKLGLTDEQKAKMQEIRRNARAEMEKVLTAEQKEQLKAAMQERINQRSQGEGRMEGRGRGKKNNPFAALNLTEAQKTRMREIKESSKQQMEAVLTPAQREQLKQMQENRKSRRQQRNSTSI